ncbi:MAG: hypothetical protein QGG09_09440 [Pirellulaceae bacterium]|nr:hypothetical protein [Pirellulaceae bacterium]HJN09651.1 hypothetical protein [Pirellulaceae bacterium]
MPHAKTRPTTAVGLVSLEKECEVACSFRRYPPNVPLSACSVHSPPWDIPTVVDFNAAALTAWNLATCNRVRQMGFN